MLSKVLTASVPVGQDYALLSIAPAFLTVQQGTSTGGNSATTLNDTRQTWSPNQWAGLTLEITGGTGAYKGISGKGTYQFNELAILAKAGGKCTMQKPPVAFQLLIKASATVTL